MGRNRRRRFRSKVLRVLSWFEIQAAVRKAQLNLGLVARYVSPERDAEGNVVGLSIDFPEALLAKDNVKVFCQELEKIPGLAGCVGFPLGSDGVGQTFEAIPTGALSPKEFSDVDGDITYAWDDFGFANSAMTVTEGVGATGKGLVIAKTALAFNVPHFHPPLAGHAANHRCELDYAALGFGQVIEGDFTCKIKMDGANTTDARQSIRFRLGMGFNDELELSSQVGESKWTLRSQQGELHISANDTDAGFYSIEIVVANGFATVKFGTDLDSPEYQGVLGDGTISNFNAGQFTVVNDKLGSIADYALPSVIFDDWDLNILDAIL